MSNSGDETKRGQDPKKVALALATLPITIIGSIGGTDDFAQASEMRQQSNDGDSQDPDSATEPAEDQDRPAKSLARQSVYEVAPGDTVALIAKKFSIGKSELMRINKLNESSLIMPGQVL